MRIYAIWNTNSMEFLKWGVNGGGKEGYCLLRGKPCFFRTLGQAKAAVQSFDKPEEYEIRAFEEVPA